MASACDPASAVSIRPIVEADAEAIAGFFAAVHRADATVGAIGVEDWREFAAAPQNRNGRDFRLAEAQGAIAGVATSSLRDHDTPWIRHFRIIVAPERRCLGTGSALLGQLAALDEPNEAFLQCLCPERWEATAEFLEARAFAVIEKELDMVLEGASRDALPRRREIGVRVLEEKAPLADALAAIHNRAYAGTPDFVHHSGAAMLARIERALVLVAERRKTLLGFCHLEPAGNAVWIESIAVDPTEQGRGVGLLLMENALAEAARRAGPRVRLSVSDRNGPAYALYRRLGFEVVARSARYRADRAAVLERLAPR